MYSAKKIDGKKLYELARKGLEVERKAVKITINELEALKGQEFRISHSEIRIRIVCSAGTYIRTLAEDIGRVVGTGAHLLELRRTRAGKFDLSSAVTLEKLEKLNDPEGLLIPLDAAVGHLPTMILSEARVIKTKSGLSTRYDGEKIANDQAIQMVNETGNLIAIGFYNRVEKVVHPKVVLG